MKRENSELADISWEEYERLWCRVLNMIEKMYRLGYKDKVVLDGHINGMITLLREFL